MSNLQSFSQKDLNTIKHHFEKIYEVELLDGFEKNRKYYAIKDDILDDFKLTEIANE